MTKDTYIYLIILGMTIVTYIPRVAPLLFFSRNEMHPELNRFVSYFPVSILTALVVKDLLFIDGNLVMNLNNNNIIPAIITLLVSIKYKSMGLSIIVGIIVYILYGLII